MRAMSVMMSDMKTLVKSKSAKKPAAKALKVARSAKGLPTVFTVRDMNRDTTTVLNAVRQHGRVTIRSRGGQEYAISRIITKKTGSAARGIGEDFSARQLRYREQMRALDGTLPGAVDLERLNRIIAGEE